MSTVTVPIGAALLAATATPSGAPDPDLVTPGTIGFLITLFIVIIVILLIRDAQKRVRRVRARSQVSDAYPIPLRKYAVPNQSTLSGADAPNEPTEDSADRAEQDRTGRSDGADLAEVTGPERDTAADAIGVEESAELDDGDETGDAKKNPGA